MSDNIYIAKLGKTVGLDGAMRLHLDSDFPEQLKKGLKLYTRKNQEFIIKSYDEKRSIIKFENILTVEDAKKLTNQELFTTITQTRENCVLSKGQYFWFDLIGCSILDGEEKVKLGVLKDIQRLPSCDYFEVATLATLIEQGFAKNFLIPYINNYVVSIDIEQKIIYTKDCFAILENS